MEFHLTHLDLRELVWLEVEVLKLKKGLEDLVSLGIQSDVYSIYMDWKELLQLMVPEVTLMM